MKSAQVTLPVLGVHGTAAVTLWAAAVVLLPKPHRAAKNIHEAQEAKVGVGVMVVFVMESAVQPAIRVVRGDRPNEHEASESVLDKTGRGKDQRHNHGRSGEVHALEAGDSLRTECGRALVMVVRLVDPFVDRNTDAADPLHMQQTVSPVAKNFEVEQPRGNVHKASHSDSGTIGGPTPQRGV